MVRLVLANCGLRSMPAISDADLDRESRHSRFDPDQRMAPGSTAIRIGMVTTANRLTSSGIHIRMSLLMAISLPAAVDSAIGSAICHKETVSSGWSTSWASDDLRWLIRCE